MTKHTCHTSIIGHFENDNDLGHYLAGLIEGDGHFSKEQLIISGHKIINHYLNHWSNR
jgi:hypothetical protein